MAIFGFALFLIAFLNTVLLAFAYRDLSLGLLAMAVLSVVGLPLATYLIMNRTNKKPLHWFVSEDDEESSLQVYTEELDKDGHANGFFQRFR